MELDPLAGALPRAQPRSVFSRKTSPGYMDETREPHRVVGLAQLCILPQPAVMATATVFTTRKWAHKDTSLRGRTDIEFLDIGPDI